MIDKIREYMGKCSYLDEFTTLNVDYLVDKVKAYSINEMPSYNTVISTDNVGNREMQFLFNFDAKLFWNEEIANNIDNSMFFENVRNWLKNNDDNSVYPEIEGITPISISATTNGYLYVANADEAIYRISCKFTYFEWRNV